MAKTLGSLPLGSYVKFARFWGADLVWEVADQNHAGYPANSTVLVSRDVLAAICFDAAEPKHQASDPRLVYAYGNGDYSLSNIRQWINSDKAGGKWYTAQHSSDEPPDAANIKNHYNPYTGKAGFLSEFTADEKAMLLSVTRQVECTAYVKKSCTDKVFLPTNAEYGGAGGTDGTIYALYKQSKSYLTKHPTPQCVSNNASRSGINSSTSQNGQYWCATVYGIQGYFDNYVKFIGANGSQAYEYAYTDTEGLVVAICLSADTKVANDTDADGAYPVTWNEEPSTPASITVPANVKVGKALEVTWSASLDPEGQTVTYVLERSYDEGTWSQAYRGSARTYTDTIEAGHTKVQYRVKAEDPEGAASGYVTSVLRTIDNNHEPVITVTSTALGTFKNTPPKWSYNVTDADGDKVTVKEYVDGTLKSTKTVTLGQTYELTLTDKEWLTTGNGQHTFRIDADDGKGGTDTKTATFTKNVTEISFELARPMTSAGMPIKALVNWTGANPAGSTLKVEICNNAMDASPAWEDCTEAALTGAIHYFANGSKTADSWAVSVRCTQKRGTASGDVYTASLSGNWG